MVSLESRGAHGRAEAIKRHYVAAAGVVARALDALCQPTAFTQGNGDDRQAKERQKRKPADSAVENLPEQMGRSRDKAGD